MASCLRPDPAGTGRGRCRANPHVAAVITPARAGRRAQGRRRSHLGRESRPRLRSDRRARPDRCGTDAGRTASAGAAEQPPLCRPPRMCLGQSSQFRLRCTACAWHSVRSRSAPTRR
jgi:hypothetical protein